MIKKSIIGIILLLVLIFSVVGLFVPKSGAQTKSDREICIEHKCNMQNCPMNIKAHIKPGEKMVCPICGEAMETSKNKGVETASRKILHYRNPMDPTVTSPVPAKDYMGMDYVPVYEEVSSPKKSESGFVVSSQKQQLIGVKKETVKKISLTKIVRVFGRVAYDPQLYLTQQEYLEAYKTVALNDLLSAAEKKLLLLGMNKAEIEDLAKQGKPQENLYLTAGQKNVWVYISVYEYEAGSVKEGLNVEVEAIAYPGETFKGKIISINPVLDVSTRTIQARAEVENLDNKLKPEMAVNAKILVNFGEKLAVPISAVLDTGLRKVVFISEEGDVLESKEVVLGQKSETHYEVLSGLKEGDIVITSGNFLIDSESKLHS